MRKSWRFSLCAAMLTTLLFPPTSGFAQSPVRECGGSAPPAWCAAAQGDRPSGWLRQRTASANSSTRFYACDRARATWAHR